MNKIILSIFVLLSVLTLFACQTQNSGKDNGKDTGTSETTCTVKFDSAGGTAVADQVVSKDGYCEQPVTPTRPGATFAGWYLGKYQWYFSRNKVTADTTLVAKWETEEYTITYDLSGGTYNGKFPQTYNVDTTPFAPETPSKEGSVFMGWLLNGNYVTTIPYDGLYGNITLVADFRGPAAEVEGSTTATATTKDNDQNIVISLTDTAPTAAKLTVKMNIIQAWDTVKVQQGDDISYVKTTLDGESRKLEVSLLPNADDAVITPIILVGEEIIESEFGTVLENGIKVDTNYFPGFVRKAVTFTIDDGNIEMDTKFLNIMRPAGIIGTFNLINTNAQTAAEYLTMYKGYEIANHHALHALPMLDGLDFDSIPIMDEIYSSGADVNYVYKTEIEGLYYIDYKQIDKNSVSPYWHPIATDETYTEYAEITKAELEAVFGEGTVVGFAYPHGKLSAAIKQYLKDAGYLYARKTGVISDTTNFAMPTDRFEWTYNANADNLLNVMKKFDEYRDDGNLKLFSFGVHSIDYNGNWDVLEEFAEKYGNRADEFYYASCRDIFEYEDAVKALIINESGITNNSDIDVFVTVDGVKTIVYANTTYNF